MRVQKINAMEVAKELEKHLDTFDYGIIVDNKKYMYDDGIPEELFDLYSTYTVDEFANNKIGTCWDFTNYQAYIFDKYDINNSNYLFFGKKREDAPNEDAITHTFTTFIYRVRCIGLRMQCILKRESIKSTLFMMLFMN